DARCVVRCKAALRGGRGAGLTMCSLPNSLAVAHQNNLIADIEKCGHGALGHGWQLWPLSRAGMRMKTPVPCSTDCAKETTDERSLWRFFETGHGFERRIERTSRLPLARTRRTPACARGRESGWWPSLGSARARRTRVRARLRARLAGLG